MVLILEGEMRVNVDDEEMVVKAQQAILLRPGGREFFRFSAACATRHSWCAVSPKLVSAQLARACDERPAAQALTQRLENVVQLGLSVPRYPRSASSGVLEALGIAALQEFVLARRTGGAASTEPDALWKSLEWISQRSEQPASLPELAAIAGVSKSQLTKLFRVHLGTTPIRHLWKTRTERGVQLLRETGLTIAEIAFRCGFQTPFHFSRCVRLLYGIPPKQIRANGYSREENRSARNLPH